MKCPRCHQPLTDDEIKSLWAARNASKRKTIGRKGGRPKGSRDSQPRKKQPAA